MTTPTVTPSKAKAWFAVLIPAIGSLVPTLLQFAGVLPAPWGPALTGILLVFAALTGVVVHQVPYAPPTVPAPTPPVPTPAGPPTWKPGDPSPWKH